ncbi:hypothetical protein D5086_024424 [Populus alba]|uniref:Uncharacterized protein n=1 Tax=Populus alba TaxID=43335 RepID=A0ACC4B645_POPAL
MSRSSFPCPGKKKCNEIPSLIPMPKRQEPLVKAWMISSGHRVMVETRYDLSNTMAHFAASSADSAMRALIKLVLNQRKLSYLFSYDYTNETTDSDIIINKLCSPWYYG